MSTRLFLLLFMITLFGCTAQEEAIPPKVLGENVEIHEPEDTANGRETAENATPKEDQHLIDATGVNELPLKTITEAECPESILFEPEATCGTIVLPENWKTGKGRVEMFFARLPATQGQTEEVPLVYLEGGPGVSVFLMASSWDNTSLREHHELILLDPRGIGLSTPNLKCPASAAASTRALGIQDPYEMVEGEVAAFLTCAEEYGADGIDLTQYTSSVIAKDIDALRQALGYKKIALFGSSYGTRLALTVMRDFPDSLHAVILDSTLPIEVDIHTEVYEELEARMHEQFLRCNADERCSEKHPDLEAEFFALLEKYKENPVELEIQHPVSGERTAVLLGDYRFLGVTYRYFSSLAPINTLPSYVEALQNENYILVEMILSVELMLFDYLDAGSHMAINCAEEVPFEYDEALETQFPELEPYLDPELDFYYVTCQNWPDAQLSATIEDKPVESDVPVLLLSGLDDIITPLDWSKETKQYLANSFLLAFPHVGHGVMFNPNAQYCAETLTLDFLTDPYEKPDMSQCQW